MGLGDEPLSASLDFNQAVQSYCVEKVELHGFFIGALTKMSALFVSISLQPMCGP